MQWLLSTSNADLTRWESRPFSAEIEKGARPQDNRDNHERVVAMEAPGPPRDLARRLADAIFRFDIFPPWMLKPVLRRKPIEAGDSVGLRYHFLPGIDLFFAARVIDRFEITEGNRWRCGFTYRTLDGHPECGEEDFVVEKDLACGKITVALRSWSRPGTLLAKLTYPLTRRWQLRAGRAALDHLEAIAREGEAPAEPMMPRGSAGVSPSRNLRTGLLRSDTRW